MTSPIDSVSAPVLAAPVPRSGSLSLFEYFRVLRDSLIATYAKEAYERDFVERTLFGRSRLLVNEPSAIKHVLLDNAANYRKSEITRRILEPGLGRGLLPRRERRGGDTVAPCRPRLTIAASPLMGR
jgi:hypothetical protein